MEENVLVTGITGFVGSHLAKKFLDKGSNVIGIVRDLKPFSSLSLLGIENDVTLVRGDVNEIRLLERVISDYQVNAVYHLAAQTIVKIAYSAPLSTFETNIKGTWNVLEASRRGNVEKVLIVSTDKAYGDNITPYREDLPLLGLGIYESSKACSDLLARSYYYSYGLKTIVSRACNIYGPGDINPRIIPNTIRSCIKGESPIIYKGSKELREYIYVDDAIEAYTLLMENIDRTEGQCYNIGSGCTISQEDLVLKILKSFKGITPKYVEARKVKEIKSSFLSSEKIFVHLGWKARVNLDEGLRKTIEWWKEAAGRTVPL